MTDPGRTEVLARFVSEHEPAGIPVPVLHHARRSLVDHMGVLLAGAEDPVSRRVQEVVTEFDASSSATVLGTSIRASAPYAAFLNAFASHVLDLDDVYNPPRTTVHGSCSVWPAIFAMSEILPVTGARALTAFVHGFETETRVARATGPAHYNAGWHVTGTAGHVGAAAAAAHAAALDHTATTHALGAGATQAAGLRMMAGSDLKSLHPAKAAHDGVLSVLLARAGLTAGAQPLDGSFGYLDVMSSDPEPDLLIADLGDEWALSSNGHKLYPSGSLTHPMIDGVLAVVAESDVTGAEVVAITAHVSPPAARFTDIRDPATGMQAKFSLTHCAAAAAAFGRVGPAELSTEVVRRADLAALRDRVSVVVDETLGKQDADIEVTLRDGRVERHRVRGNRGTPASPLSDDELDTKFRDLVGARFSASLVDQLLDACWHVDQLPDMASIPALTTGGVRA